ncbi:MAG: hypothetical protein NT014_06445 [Candidatus Omnitrophica bacterium]|nr:hypothetical protein [Candidatus Omnitrophota bacterium]
MNCPMHVDYVRECVSFINLIQETNTTLFCCTEQYENCPFYKTIKKIGYVCKMVNICPIYKDLSINDFARFSEITSKYCLSNNNVNCARFKIKESGKIPPINLMPDGKSVSWGAPPAKKLRPI